MTSEQRQRLATFLRQYDKLRETELGQAGINVAWNIGFGVQAPPGGVERPSNAQIIEFLARFRPFYANDDAPHFFSICNLLFKDGGLDDDERDLVATARSRWQEAGKHSPYKIHGFIPSDWLNMYFNSDVFHPGDPEEQAALDELLAHVGTDFGYFVLMDAIIEHVRPLIALANIAYRVNERLGPY